MEAYLFPRHGGVFEPVCGGFVKPPPTNLNIYKRIVSSCPNIQNVKVKILYFFVPCFDVVDV